MKPSPPPPDRPEQLSSATSSESQALTGSVTHIKPATSSQNDIDPQLCLAEMRPGFCKSNIDRPIAMCNVFIQCAFSRTPDCLRLSERSKVRGQSPEGGWRTAAASHQASQTPRRLSGTDVALFEAATTKSASVPLNASRLTVTAVLFNPPSNGRHHCKLCQLGTTISRRRLLLLPALQWWEG